MACLGSSSTAAQGQAFGWIDELAQRPRNRRFRFQNLGVGGDLAYNALQRVPSVIASRPNRVVILIGANDVLTMVSKNARQVLGGWMKHLPRDPSMEWFQENLETIVQRLTHRSSAQIALASLGPVGEDPNSTNPVQHQLNDRIAELSGIIKQTAVSHKTAYIPFYEKFHEQLLASAGKALTEFRFLPPRRFRWTPSTWNLPTSCRTISTASVSTG